MRVLETQVVRAFAMIQLLDAASTPPRPIDDLPVLALDTVPRGLRVLARTGALVLTFERGERIGPRPDFSLPTLEDPSPAPALALSGIVSTVSQRYLPRRFTLSVADGATPTLSLFPSPLGTRIGTSGALIAHLRHADRPVPWAVLALEVSLPPSRTLTFHGQTDARGDVVIAMHRLPVAPASVTPYAATIRASWSADASADSPADPDLHSPAALSFVGTASSPTLALQVSRGKLHRLPSDTPPYLPLILTAPP